LSAANAFAQSTSSSNVKLPVWLLMGLKTHRQLMESWMQFSVSLTFDVMALEHCPKATQQLFRSQ
jgi:hypothetical protein